MAHTIFVHGVPDSPRVWAPLTDALALDAGNISIPALPGFGCERPAGFAATKDTYTDWLLSQIQDTAERSGGPVRLVGHDWGALLVLRAASLRPDLVESWAVSNAVIDSQYTGHRMARMWATPLLGEFVMRGMRNEARMTEALTEAGLPADIAAHEAGIIDKTMRQCILSLYRSARGLRFSGAWEDDLANLPKRGLLIWGETDPYVQLPVAERFSTRWDVPLHVVRGAGHWAIAERESEVATKLEGFWKYP